LTPTVLCTGYPSLDHVAHVDRPAIPGGTRVIRHHWAGGTAGGCAASVAVALARLGMPSAVAFPVGDDDDSRTYVSQLERSGVDTSRVERRLGEALSRAYFFVDEAGDGELFFDPAAARSWRGPAVFDLTGVGWLVVTVGPGAANRRFIDAARRAGVPVVWQLKRDRDAYPPADFAAYLAASDVVFANEGEVRDLCEQVGAPDARSLLAAGPSTVVVTHGAEGAAVTDRHGTIEVPALQVDVVDATGAGDAFTAGFLFGAIQRQSAWTCARLGTVLASFAVEDWGAQSRLPTLAQAEQRYADAFGEALPLPAARSSA
jgi:sugar/nucleoside kinase (ribokinase family)